MKRTLIAYGIAQCMILGGCASNPNTVQSKIESSTVVLTLAEAASSTPLEVQVGKQQRLHISEESPVLRDGSSTASFHNLKVALSGAEKISVEIQSYCDCIGLHKYVMVPRLFLWATGKSITELPPSARRYESPGWIDPASILSTWDIPLTTGLNSLMIVADTRAIGGEVIQVTTQTMIAAGGIFVPITGALQLVAYPYGKYEVRIREKD